RNFVRTSHDSRVIGSVLGTLTLRYPLDGHASPHTFLLEERNLRWRSGQPRRYHEGRSRLYVAFWSAHTCHWAIWWWRRGAAHAAYRTNQRFHVEHRRWQRQQLRDSANRSELRVLTPPFGLTKRSSRRLADLFSPFFMTKIPTEIASPECFRS